MKTQTIKHENGVEEVVYGTGKVKINSEVLNGYESFRLTWNVGGKRIRRSISDETKARLEAERVAKSLHSAEGDKTLVRGDDIVYFRECQKKLQGVALHTAVDFYLKYHGISSGEPISFETVSEEFLEDRKKQKKLAGKKLEGDRYIQSLRTHINTWQSAFGKKEIRSITPAVIAEQLSDKWMEKYGLVTKKKLLATLGSIMRFAQLKNYVSREHLPTDEVKLPRAPKKSPEIFTPEELMKILICVDAKALPYFVIMAFAGGRRSELEKSGNESLNLEDKRMNIPPEIAKKNAGRRMKIKENLELWLKEFAADEGKLVSSTRVSSPYIYKDKFKKVGVTWKSNGLRHSFCTYFTELVDNLDVVSRQAGNSPSMLEKHYVSSNISNADAQEWFAITPESVRQYAHKKGLAKLLTW